jgi:multidrug resistance efflux pump
MNEHTQPSRLSGRIRRLAWATLVTAVAVSGCERSSTDAPAPTAEAPTAPTNRVDINAAVRQNLGITFAKVEERNVARTLRVPGRFELLPTAKREYRIPVPGQVELLVEQYQPIEAGTPLYRLDSPRWRELQRELTDAHSQVTLAQAGVDSVGPFMEAHEKHHTAIQNAVDLWTQRVDKLEALEAAGGARGEDVAQAKASLATARSELAETLEKEAELVARESEVRAQLDAARGRLAILLRSASSLTGRSAEELLAVEDEEPAWRTIDAIEVRAHAPGVVDALHAVSGAFVDQNASVLDTLQPDRVRFRANALQSDLGRLAQGLPAMVVAPQGGSLGTADSLSGTLALAPTADSERRTIELVMTPSTDAAVPTWARAGVSGFLEVVVRGGERPELAIPLACVVRDGTQSIIFRRDPGDPDKAIRMEADLGIDDGRWIVVRSGVAEGNEIVLDGVYQLMVATSGSITKGGHFHPDGTFHEGDD